MTVRLRTIALVLLAATAVLLPAGCSRPSGSTPLGAVSGPATSGDPAGVPAATAEVVVDNFAFTPAALTVAAGTRVTWINRDDVPHTATSSLKPRTFDSGPLDTDGRFSHVFSTPGTYEYFCAVHPHMTARIIVR
jgi:plastocyanin